MNMYTGMDISFHSYCLYTLLVPLVVYSHVWPQLNKLHVINEHEFTGENQQFVFSTRSDTNRPVQSQKKARMLDLR